MLNDDPAAAEQNAKQVHFNPYCVSLPLIGVEAEV